MPLYSRTLIYKVNSFQFTRSARLVLALPEEGKVLPPGATPNQPQKKGFTTERTEERTFSFSVNSVTSVVISALGCGDAALR